MFDEFACVFVGSKFQDGLFNSCFNFISFFFNFEFPLAISKHKKQFNFGLNSFQIRKWDFE